MPTLGPILDHVGPFLLVLFRISGVLVFAPMLASSVIPARVRMLIAAALALSVYPVLPAAQTRPMEMDVLSLLPVAIGEVLIGVAIGLIAALPIFALQLAGLIMGQQAGIALGQVYNPALEAEVDVIGQLMVYAGIAIFVSLGGLETLFLAAAETFKSVPVGSAGWTLGPVDLISGLVASGFQLALRVSAPVLCIILIETIAAALLAKTIPQINVQSVGFAIKVIITLLVLAASAGAIVHAAGGDIQDALNAVGDWTRDLAPMSAAPSLSPPLTRN